MLLAIDVGNTETVIGLYDLGGDDAAVPPPTSASASPSRTSRPAGSPTAGDLDGPQPNPDELAVLFTQLLDLRASTSPPRSAAWPCPPRCPRSPASCARWRHGGSPPSPAWCSAGGAQRHADPLRQPERGRRRPRGQRGGRLRALRRPVHRRSTSAPPPPSTPSPRSASTSAGPSPRGWPSAWRRSSSTRRPSAMSSWSPRAASSGVRPSSPSSRERSTASVPR